MSSNLTATANITIAAPAFELRFDSLHHSGRSLRFPCDGGGAIELDTLGDRARDNYLFARATMGRLYAFPTVQPVIASH